ncbi:M15 family metallopeptidase [Streptomyces sp. N2-109]|uniref:D-alanyl-D-alanine dipeptidase n=1 Tax=Streptomyces gossypii TaxID=2883101 RepID=A0ABT2K371_9ACTN|nr:M15 family metallopeptidase [Streptomyces gossypii]MCT2594541.1 M15 family metallopeptidase [Streptomyces gossypii]
MAVTGFRGGRAAAVLALVCALVMAPPSPQGAASAPRTPAAARLPAGFVSLREAAPTVRQEIRYFTRHNFTGARVDGYRRPLCLLTVDAARALREAQRHFLKRGYTLKVYDCYRPQRAVDEFVRWAGDTGDRSGLKREFYPRVDKSQLLADGYIAAKSGHSRGSTVDLTLVELPAPPTRPYVPGEPLVPCIAPREERFPDNSVDMGTGYDCFDPLSRTLDERVAGRQRANRLLLKRGLERAGFRNYPAEWWHYTYEPETFPDTYFDFPVER